MDALQLRAALAQHDTWGGRLANVVTEMGLASEDKVVDALSAALNIPRVRLGNLPRDPVVLGKVDVNFAEQRGVFPVQLRDNGKVLALAMADPTDLDTLDEVNRRARARVVTYIAGEREVRSAIARYYRGVEAALPPERTPTADLPMPGDDQEFKIVDMSGRTVMKRLSELEPGSASDILDDILGGGQTQALTAEELQRLQTVRANQEKSAKIIRVVQELLVEKGYLSADQLQRLRS